MADPDVVAMLDRLDRVQVRLYRCGIGLAALALALPMLAYRGYLEAGWFSATLVISAVLLASSLHIYDKLIRFTICNLTWLALTLFTLGALLGTPCPPWLFHGLLLVTVSGVAYKESYCFKLPGLKLVPLIAALATLANGLALPGLFAATLLPGAVLLLWLTVAKCRMPLHFDIGDKCKYQL
jgi:uncharacterized integral membrane protein